MPTDEEGAPDERCHDASSGLVLRLEHQLLTRMVGGTDALKDWRRRGFFLLLTVLARYGAGSALAPCRHAITRKAPVVLFLTGIDAGFLLPHPPRRAVWSPWRWRGMESRVRLAPVIILRETNPGGRAGGPQRDATGTIHRQRALHKAARGELARRFPGWNQDLRNFALRLGRLD